MKFSKIYIWSTFISLTFLVFACSTEKEGFLNTTYHEVTAHYNGYFNAKEKMKEALKKYGKDYKYNFTEVVPIELIPSEEDGSSVFPAMEVAIEKATVVITKHAMPNPNKSKKTKKEEWNDWIDDNWMVIGKARFYKRNFVEAIEIFDHVYRFFQDKETSYEARLWKAKALTQMGKYTEAQILLEELINEFDVRRRKLELEAANKKAQKKFSKAKKKSLAKKEEKIKKRTANKATISEKLKPFMLIAYVDLAIKKEEYGKASFLIHQCLAADPPKKFKGRLYFALGQLSEKNNSLGEAVHAYGEARTYNIPYVMNFESQIRQALAASGSNADRAIPKLMKMVKDNKNKEYIGKIYFAIGQLYVQNNQKEKAVEYLKTSLREQGTDKLQKTKAFVYLADLFFEDKEYVPSKMYYDSTLTVADDFTEVYNRATTRSANLSGLVQALSTIEEKDSLLNITKMSDSERKSYIKKVIRAAEKEEERLEDLKETQDLLDANTVAANVIEFGFGAEWYFYNETTKAKGIASFKKTWGKRKLEDNWRRKNKISESSLEGEDLDSDEEEEEFVNPLFTEEYYLKNLPTTTEEIAVADSMLAHAMYDAAIIYKDDLGEEKLAFNMLNKMWDRYQEDSKGVSAAYQLYLYHLTKLQEAKANRYKEIILSQYATSEYANIIKNPNFKKEEDQATYLNEREYQSVFKSYRRKRFDQVFQRANDVIEEEPDNKFLAQYYHMRSLAYAQIPNRTDSVLIVYLQATLTKYPKEEVGKESELILNSILKKKKKIVRNKGESLFLYSPKDEHYFVLVVNKGNGTLINNDVASFHSVYFKQENLKSKVVLFKDQKQFLLVRKFKNAQKARIYSKAFEKEDKYLKNNAKDLKHFIVSKQNYITLYKKKNLDEYMTFYNAVYSDI